MCGPCAIVSARPGDWQANNSETLLLEQSRNLLTQFPSILSINLMPTGKGTRAAAGVQLSASRTAGLLDGQLREILGHLDERLRRYERAQLSKEWPGECGDDLVVSAEYQQSIADQCKLLATSLNANAMSHWAPRGPTAIGADRPKPSVRLWPEAEWQFPGDRQRKRDEES